MKSVLKEKNSSSLPLKHFVVDCFMAILLLLTASTTVSGATLGAGFGACEGTACRTTNGSTYPELAGCFNADVGAFNATFHDDAVGILVGGNYTARQAAEAEGLVVVLGNFHAEGTVGNYNIGGVGAGACVTQTNGGDAMVVGGTAEVELGATLLVSQLNNPLTTGDLRVGAGITNNGTIIGNFATSVAPIPNDSTVPAILAPYSASLTEFQSKSTCYASEVALSTTAGGASPTFDGAGAATDLIVFEVTGDISGGINFTNIPATATVLINMTKSGTVTLNTFAITNEGVVGGNAGGFTGFGDLRQRILWNFPNASDVVLSGFAQYEGSLLIPTGNLSLEAPGHNGRVIVGGNLVHDSAGSEFHNYDFIGDDLPACAPVAGSGSITISKNAIENDAQDFDFAITGGASPAAFTLDDDLGAVGEDATNSDTQVFSSLADGTYSISETSVAGWDLNNIQCTGASASTITIGASGGFDSGDDTVTIDLLNNEDISCTFVNTTPVVALGTLTVNKTVDWNGRTPDPLMVFSYSITGPSGFTTINDTLVDGATDTFTDIPYGDYTVTETSPGTGWSTTYTIDAGTPQATGALSLGATVTPVPAAEISGETYIDYDSNGVNDLAEPGIGAVTVSVYGTDGALCGTTSSRDGVGNPTAGAIGTYSITPSCDGPWKLEFSGEPSGLNPSFVGGDNFSSAQFIGASNLTGNDVGYVDVAGYCQPNPKVATPLYINGNQTGAQSVLSSVNYDRTGAASTLALANQIGSTWGLAYQRSTEKLYASAVVKRHSGLGALGIGGVYVIDDPAGTPTASTFIDVSSLGIDFGTIGSNVARGLPANVGDQNTDAAAYGQAGVIGIGDIDISVDESTLWMVNLNNRSVVSVDIAGGVAPTSAQEFNLLSGAGAPVCTDGVLRPWGLKIKGDTGYLGAVCTAESQADAGVAGAALTLNIARNLEAYVFSFSTSDPVASITQELQIPLDYSKEGANDAGVNTDIWMPWRNTYSDGFYNGILGQRPTPMLTDIDFDDQGHMILGFADRSGFQIGGLNRQPDNPGAITSFAFPAGGAIGIQIGGDLLKACNDGSGVFVLENNGVCDGVTGSGPASSGPGGLSFYDAVSGIVEHREASTGGVAVRKGSGELVYSAMDPETTIFAGGLQWNQSVANGARTDGFQFWNGTEFDVGFGGGGRSGKANGQGDVEILCDPAPIQVGNLVWDDLNQNGIQDAGEPGINGVVVTLTPVGGGVAVNDTTSGDGNYDFTVDPNTEYDISIGTPPVGYSLSPQNQHGDSSNNSFTDIRDSDAIEVVGIPTINVTTGLAGDNNHSLDFGFYQPLVVDTVITNTAPPAMSLGSTVFSDTNNNAMHDAGELGIQGVVVQLFTDLGVEINVGPDGILNSADDAPGGVVTDVNGNYFFQELLPGDYRVEIPASNFTSGNALENLLNSSTDTTTTSNTDNTGIDEDDNGLQSGGSGTLVVSPTINLSDAGETNPETNAGGSGGDSQDNGNENNGDMRVDFGFFQPVAIGNVVFMDNGAGGGVSNDGIKQAGELGVGGVVVELYASGDTPGVDSPVDTTVTAADGSYILTASAGLYFVHIPASEFTAAEPLEDKVSSTGQGAADNSDDDTVAEDGDDNEADGVSSGTYNLQPGLEPTGEAGFVGTTVSPVDDNNTNSTADFGFYQPVSIGNVVWMDNGVGGGVSNNGIMDGSEIGVAGVEVELYSAGDTAGVDTPVATTTTAADGSYILTTSPGSYFVHIPASEFDPAEPLEEKVSTTGQGAADNTDDDTVAEDGDDNEADGVSSGVYDLQPNLEPTGEAGFVGTTVSPSDDNNTNSTVDFGFYEPVSLGNLVWMDNGAGGGVSNNGIIDGAEAGIAGVELELYASGDTPGVDTPAATTTTAADGSYVFDAITPGSYFVHIPVSEFALAEPLNQKVSSNGQGAADNADDDNVAEDGDDVETDGVSSGVYALLGGSEPTSESGFSGVSLSSQDDDNTNLTADFGFYEPVAVGNIVWMDNGAGGGVANDGIKQAGEAGVVGVVVELYAAGDTPGVDTPVDTAISAADGSYILSTSPGSYFVHIPASEFGPTEPLEEKVSTTGQGAADNTDDDDVAEDGDDTEADGVSSNVYDLQVDSEPVAETGFVGTAVSPSDDNNTNSTVDFGFYEPVSLGNLVWMDNGAGGGVSNNGIIDGAEIGIAGVVVELYAAGDTPGVDTPVASTTTAADGSYLFDAFAPGSYFVHIPVSEFAATEPLEDKVSSTGQGAADNADDDNVAEDGDDVETDGVSSGVYVLIGGSEPTGEAGFVGTTTSTLDDNNTNSTADFGFYQPVAIGNVVYMDNGAGGGVSNDGIKQAGEIGVAGVEVELYLSGDTAGVDTPVATTTTAADGSYILTTSPGSYFVHIPVSEFAATEPLEDKVSSSGQGAADNTDDDTVAEDGDDNEADGVSSGVYDLQPNLEPTGEAGFVGTTVSPVDDDNTNSTVDFGFYQPVSVGNVVWMDNGVGGGVSNNGIMDGSEIGVAGVEVELYAAGDTPGVDTPVDTTTTAADGSYILTTSPGSYFVHIPASEFDPAEPLEEKVSTTGQGAADNTDDDNVAEDGDDTEADGVSSGVYALQPNLEPTGEAGFVGTTVSPSDDNNTNSTVDFGFYEPMSLGNLVWMDNGVGGGVSNNGIIDGAEVGIAGVVVELYASGDTPGVDTPVASTTTAADGSYLFDAFAPGSYFVHIPVSEFAATEPLEDKVSSTGQGAADNADDDNVAEDGDDVETDGVSSGVYVLIGGSEPTGEAGFVGTTTSTLDDNNTNSTADFGFYQPVAIGNVVYMDNGAGGGVSNDGIKQAGEIGVAGVEVELYAAGDTPGVDTPVATTTTAADGSYILTTSPGSYFVHIPVSEFAATEPLEDKVSSSGQGSADNTDDDNVAEDGDDTEADGVSSNVYDLRADLEPTGEAGFVGTTVSPVDDNNTNSTADFGFYQPVSVGNVVWMDNGVGSGVSNNGIMDGSEIGVAGVEVELYAAGDTPGVDTPFDTTTTATDGSYILTTSPGSYFVHIPASEFDPAEPLEEKVSTTGQGVADNTDDDNVAEDGDDNEADGVSSGVYDLQPNLEPTGESGFVGTTLSPSDDNNTNSTVDFGFYEPVSLGNMVWMDDGAVGGVSNNGIIDGGEVGIAGVVVELYASGDAPGVDTPAVTTTTAADGSYLFDAIAPGSYFVHIPVSEFAGTEPLEDKVSSTGQGAADNADDDNVAEDGDDVETDGVSSGVYVLLGGSEPTGEAGFVGTTTSTLDDDNTNSTADFGFYQPVAIGNVVYMDNGAGGGVSNDGIKQAGESGVAGVEVELYAAGDTPGVDTPFDTTTTAADGSYILTTSPGEYFVHIPVSEFAATEPLEEKVSTTGQGAADNTDDDNVAEDGDDNETDGVSSGVYDLQPNLEPTGEAGFVGTTVSPSDDNNTNSTADFGFYEPVSLGNLVWMDNGAGGGVSNNGIIDGGEVGIAGVVVELYASGDTPGVDTPAATTTTAADGSYLFDAIAPGSYFAHIPVSEFAGTEPLEDKVSSTGQGAADNADDDNISEDGDDVETDGVSSGVYVLLGGSEPTSEAGFVGTTTSTLDDDNTNSTADFGFYQPVAIGNVVYMDNGAGGGVSNDGIKQAGESGVAGVEVELYAAGDTPGVDTPFDSTTTATDGSYILTTSPGEYFVHIPVSEFAATEPLEDKVSSSGQGAADNTDDDNVAEDGDDNEADGVSSNVYDLQADTEPAGEAGFVGTTTSTLDDDNTNSTADFGFYQPVSVGNVVWMDNGVGGGVSNNGIMDGSEIGVAGVEVELYSASDTAGVDTPVATSTTAADGSYILTTSPGSYFVHIPASEFAATEPLEEKVSTTGQGAADNTDDDNVAEDGDDTEADGVSSGVYDLQPNLEPTGEAGFVGTTVSPSDDNNTNSTVDFGFYEPVSLGNVVWMDNGAGGGVSNNGIIDGGEVGIAGVVVELYASGDTSGVDTPAATTATAADGSYLFDAIAPGSYFVHIPVSEFAATEPLEDKVSSTGQGAADNADDDNVSEDGDDVETDGVSSGVYVLLGGSEPTSEAGFVGTTTSTLDDDNTNSTADFGFYQPVAIGNVVYMDNGAGGGVSNDGIKQSGESGVAGVEVELYAAGDTPGVDTPFDTTTTAADGSYILTTSPGEYFVHIPVSEFAATEPLEDKVSSSGQGAADNTDDDNVAEDGDDNEADGVSSNVYDLQADTEPAGEAGFVGTTVSPVDDDNTNSTADFGFYQPVSVGNVVWMDNGVGGGVSNNGIMDGSEIGVAGVEVELYSAGDTAGVDTPVATTTTAADGSYILTTSPGSYFVHIPASEFAATEPLAEKVSTIGQGAADNTDDDNVAEDGDDTEADGVSSGVYDLQPNLEPTGEAGFVGITVSPSDDNNTNSTADFGFYEPVSLGNLVWMDNGAGGGVSNNGIIDGGEVGIAGVVVELYASGDAPGVDTPAATTTTAADGSYLFDAIAPGSYFVHIPVSEFAGTEPLEDKVSSTGQGAADNADDDNISEDGDDVETDGVSSGVYVLLGGSEPTSEAGFVGTTTSTLDDDNTNSTADFGFYQPVAIGNVVYMDNGAGGGVSNDGIKQSGESGVAGVEVELYAAGDTPGVDTPFDTTTTAADGSYILTTSPGEYFVHIPVSEFAATEPLEDKVSSSGQGAADNTDDDNVAEDGDDNEADGVSSNVYDLQADTEPAGEAGFVGTTVSPVDDNNTNNTADFGFYQPVSVGNVVWVDNGIGGGVSNNGVIDGAESGVVGVVVELYAAGDTPGVDTPFDATTTAADGSYILTTSPGSYFVHIPASEFAASEPLEEKVSTTGQGAADNSDDDNVAEDGDDNEVDGVSSGVYNLQPNLEPVGEAGFVGTTVSPSDDNNTNSTVDFGFYEPVSLGNVVWMDDGSGGGVPNDGIINGAEAGVNAVVIELYAIGDTPGVDTPVTTTSSASDGSYLFDAIAPGEYFVHIPLSEFGVGEPLEGAVSSVGQGIADNTDDDDVAEDGDDIEADGVSTGVYTLLGDTEPVLETGFVGLTLSTQDDDNTNLTADMAFLVPVSLGSLVWDDLNGDGLQTPDEPPVAGVDVNLLIESGLVFIAANDLQSVPVPSQTTGSDGLYFFGDMPSGNYKVQLVLPSGYAPSPVQTVTDNDDNELDSNIALEVSAGVFESGVFTLESLLEPNETLAKRGDNQDASTDGSPADLSGNMTVDFALAELASLGNYVWLDLDMDGVQDANEEGIANVTVNLLEDSDGNGVIDGTELTTPVATATTGPNGEYLFSDLTPGVVYISQVDASTVPTSYVQTYDEGPTPGSLGTLDHTSDPIVLAPGEEHLTADFGYTPPLGSIGDTIWVDVDDDGVQDPGEPGIPGVTVTLTPPPGVDPDGAGPLNPGDPVVVVTDANGHYLFTDLPLNEVYFINVSGIPPEYSLSPSGLGDPDVRDGNSDPSEANNQTVVALTSEIPVNLDADFGYIPDPSVNNSIGDTVWLDVDEDGNGPAGAGDGSDPSEPAIPGVTVTLIQDNGDGVFNPVDDTVLGATITDANGNYLFTGIPDGDYIVIVTDQNNVLGGLSQTFDADDPANPGAFTAVTPNASFIDDLGVGIATPVLNSDQDFGYVEPNSSSGDGTIGDTIFFDEDDSGTFEVGEGIEGVTVQLYSPGPDGIIGNGDDVLIGSTTTDENGHYLFTGLDTSDTGPDPGTDYQVVVVPSSLPNGGTGWENSVDPDTPVLGDNESVTTLTSAAPIDLDQDFGYTSSDNNSLSGTIWPDTDGDGSLVETGRFEGVTVELRDENGNVIKTTQTDANGDFMFSNLPDGIYVVVVTDDDNVLNGYEHTDSPNGVSDTGDLTSKDDTGYTVDLDSAGASSTPVTNATSDFGYQPTVTNPISLGSFKAELSERGEGEVQISWATQTEVANLGFNLYAQEDGDWVQLNDALILGQGDSVSVQSYSATFETPARLFAISDIDLAGKETLHGPYSLGESYGDVSDRKVIDWAAEKAERESKKAARESSRKQQQSQRLEARQLKAQSK